MTAAVTSLAGPRGATIPASNVQLLVVRYKGLNHGAVYTITPKYIDRVPIGGIDIRAGVTRSFWVVVKVPEGAAAGKYRGRVTLGFPGFQSAAGDLKRGGAGRKLPGGETDAVDVSLTVWPIKLVVQIEEPDFPVGMFMVGPFVNYFRLAEGDVKGNDAYWREWETILADAREHGMTSLDPSVGIPLRSVTGGRAQVDFSKMDRFMELAKRAGFRQELNGYAVGTGFRFRNCSHSDGQARAFGLNTFGELVRVYFDAVRQHSKEKRWLPICFCTDDEYIVHPGGSPEKLAELHRTLQSNAPGFRFVAFDSVYLESKPGSAREREKMLTDIDTFGAGVHSALLSAAMKRARRRLWLYNTGMNRFTFGTYMFFARKKHDVKGFFQWVYPSTGTYTPHYLASHNEAHYGVVYPSTRGLRTTVTWERLRAGCDDHRYLETGWRLIQKARALRRALPRAGALEATIEKVMGRLTFGKPRADAFDGVGRAENPMSPDVMEAFRRAVAVGIVELQRALE